MPKQMSASSRARVSPMVLAAVRPLNKRLTRIEALLLEMRGALDTQIKKTTRLQLQLESLAPGGRRR
jgi:hypothetical protein